MPLAHDEYTISAPRTGDARVYDLALTGWGNALATVSDNGRLYWSITTGGVVTFYSSEAKGVGDAVCAGTIASGAVTLTESNGSGVSGSARIALTSGVASHGEVIVSYADEPDLLNVMADATSLLDGSSQWNGTARFELAFRTAKDDLDKMLVANQRTRLTRKATNEFDLSSIAKPRELARVHAYLVAAILQEHRASFRDYYGQDATRLRKRASDLLAAVTLSLDYCNDDTVDVQSRMGTVKVVR
jgi:hypothetical protein